MRLLLAGTAGILTGIYIKRKLDPTPRAGEIPFPLFTHFQSTAAGIGSGIFAGALSYWITGAVGGK